MSRLLTAGISGTLLALSVIATAAPKEGKGNPGGGGAFPELIGAPVVYEITLLEWTESSNFALLDINCEGFAVGWVKPTSSGVNRAIAADSSGNVWDLNDVFTGALQSQQL
jgi:hypothetical protein